LYGTKIIGVSIFGSRLEFQQLFEKKNLF